MNYLGAILMIISAFIIGALTLKTFLEVAKKIRFDYFLVIFGIIAVLAVIIGFLLQ
jgi:undecaprenyl pyrophosphate phosphatase UppP